MDILNYIFLATYALMAIWGAVTLGSGVVTISNEYVVKGQQARLLALLLIAAFPLGFILKILAKNLGKMDKLQYENSWYMFDGFAIVACGVAFMGLGMYLAPPIDGSPNVASKAEKKTAAQRRAAGKK